MNDKRICPLLTIAGAAYHEGLKYCEGKGCAWWISGVEACSVQTIPLVMINREAVSQ